MGAAEAEAEAEMRSEGDIVGEVWGLSWRVGIELWVVRVRICVSMCGLMGRDDA